MYSNGKRLLYCPRALWPALFLLSILPANAEERTAYGTAQEYVQCLQTGQTAMDSAATARFVTKKGLTPSSFSLWSAADGAPIAQVLVERPGDERFEKVSASMQTLVEEVAKLRHVPTARKELADGINIISVNPNAPEWKCSSRPHPAKLPPRSATPKGALLSPCPRASDGRAPDYAALGVPNSGSGSACPRSVPWPALLASHSLICTRISQPCLKH
jgi:hypothetical protein